GGPQRRVAAGRHSDRTALPLYLPASYHWIARFELRRVGSRRRQQPRRTPAARNGDEKRAFSWKTSQGQVANPRRCIRGMATQLVAGTGKEGVPRITIRALSSLFFLVEGEDCYAKEETSCITISIQSGIANEGRFGPCGFTVHCGPRL